MANRSKTARMVNGVVRIHGSKSITHRALMMGAMAEGVTHVRNALFCDDTFVTADALRTLGFQVDVSRAAGEFIIKGLGGALPGGHETLDLDNCGTALRFLCAFLCAGGGNFVVDGNERMRKRPIKGLVQALIALGPDIEYQGDEGCPPVKIASDGIKGGHVVLDSSQSSQYLSSVLLSAPYAARDVKVDIDYVLVSRPYVDLTISMMREFGVIVRRRGYEQFVVRCRQTYQGADYRVEGDMTAACYLFAAAAITGGHVRVEGINPYGEQGDVKFLDILEEMGCSVKAEARAVEVTGGPLKGVHVDMGDMPDVIPTLAVVAAMADGPTRMTHTRRLQIKEINRARALVEEMNKVGIAVTEEDDTLTVQPGPIEAAQLDAHGDHRMAMSLGLLGLVNDEVELNGRDAVTKSFPGFFEILEEITHS